MLKRIIVSCCAVLLIACASNNSFGQKITGSKTVQVKSVIITKEEPKTGSTMAAVAKNILSSINKKRVGVGLAELVINEKASEAARAHCKDMIELDFFGHKTPDGVAAGDRLKKAGLTDWLGLGQLIGSYRGPDPEESIVKLWMESASQKDRLMSANFNEAGIGADAKPDGTYYFTIVLLKLDKATPKAVAKPVAI